MMDYTISYRNLNRDRESGNPNEYNSSLSLSSTSGVACSNSSYLQKEGLNALEILAYVVSRYEES